MLHAPATIDFVFIRKHSPGASNAGCVPPGPKIIVKYQCITPPSRVAFSYGSMILPRLLPRLNVA